MAVTTAARERQKPWRWLPLGAVLGLWLLTMLVAFPAVSLLHPVRRWGHMRLYSVRSMRPGAPLPPLGVSGVNLAPDPWIQQRLRIGDVVLEWCWSPRRDGQR
jgi:hypothetical protein